jgi:hypothetical protein
MSTTEQANKPFSGSQVDFEGTLKRPDHVKVALIERIHG